MEDILETMFGCIETGGIFNEIFRNVDLLVWSMTTPEDREKEWDDSELGKILDSGMDIRKQAEAILALR